MPNCKGFFVLFPTGVSVSVICNWHFPCNLLPGRVSECLCPDLYPGGRGTQCGLCYSHDAGHCGYPHERFQGGLHVALKVGTCSIQGGLHVAFKVGTCSIQGGYM